MARSKTMLQIRLIHIYSLVVMLIFGIVLHAPVLAQSAPEVKVRTGSHAQYSRLVFDWKDKVGYSVERSEKNRLIIAFDKAAKLDVGAAKSNPVANISALDVVSADPLRVSITIPEDSRVRDLRAGNKVVVDVYNPPGGASKPEKIAVSDKQPEVAKKPAKKVEKKKEEPAKAVESADGLSRDLAEAVQGESVTTPEQAELEPPETRQLTMREQVTMATISSTESFGMAAFGLGDKIWLVNDKSNLLLKPQMSGPLAGDLLPIQEVLSDKGKAHIIPKLRGRKVKGFGGDVLWRVMMGRDLEIKKAPEPVRPGVNREDVRSGALLWPLQNARAVLELEDPVSGRTVKVVTVEDSGQFAGPPRDFIDFEVLHSHVGLAIIPKVSDLKVEIVRGGIEISRPGGLTMVEGLLLASMTKPKKKIDDEGESTQRIFDFKAWQLGGTGSLLDNKRIILGNLKDEPDSAKTESLLTLGKMYTANAMGAEALGILNFTAYDRPGMWDNPEFTALYGVASALAHHNEDAFHHLSQDVLKPFEEVNYWRAFVLADEGDWQQAAQVFPQNLSALSDYSVLLQNRLVPVLAEVALRAGSAKKAGVLLQIAEENKDSMLFEQQAALVYLKGEVARQADDVKGTKKLWEPLTTGPDDRYRAKAGLALTRLQVDMGELSTDEAIDNLERLRYAWRGDQLEVQIHYWLGQTYFDNGAFIKGLKIMREAASYDPGTPLGQRITAEMADIFVDLFLGSRLEKVSPLDAIGLYNEFKELVPLDESGNVIIERLAEHLVTADLLTRAGDLLKYQLDHRLEGADIYRVGVRVAAIRLIDRQPGKALKTLDIAAAQLEKLPEEMKTQKRYREISMLRARALSHNGRPDQALALLTDIDRTAEMNRLRADIAWIAGYWDDAAEALGDVIVDQNISLTRPLEDENTAMLLQRGIALNLASDRIALANMREKYSDLMSQTSKAKVFEVITRPRQSGALADRETLLSVVSEVDLFKDFLDSYKNPSKPVN